MIQHCHRWLLWRAVELYFHQLKIKKINFLHLERKNNFEENVIFVKSVCLFSSRFKKGWLNLQSNLLRWTKKGNGLFTGQRELSILLKIILGSSFKSNPIQLFFRNQNSKNGFQQIYSTGPINLPKLPKLLTLPKLLYLALSVSFRSAIVINSQLKMLQKIVCVQITWSSNLYELYIFNEKL
jgi:hypothetical protein